MDKEKNNRVSASQVSADLKKELDNFVRYCIWVSIACIAFAIVIVLINGLSAGKLKIDAWSSVGSFLQGTIGIAVSLAGAYVAIRIASMGHDMVKRENSREDYLASKDIIDSTIPPFFKLTQECQELIDIYKNITVDEIYPLIHGPMEGAVIEMVNYKRQHTKRKEYTIKPRDFVLKIDKEKKEKAVDIELLFLEKLRIQLTNVRKALEEIRANAYSYCLFINLAKEYEVSKKSLLTRYKEKAEKEAEDGKKNTVHWNLFSMTSGVNDLIYYLTSFEELMVKKIRNPRFNDLYMPFLSLFSTAELAETDVLSTDNKLKLDKISMAHMMMTMGLMIGVRSWWEDEPDDKISSDPDNGLIGYFNMAGVIFIDLLNILCQDHDTYIRLIKKMAMVEEGVDLSKQIPFLNMLSDLRGNNVWFTTSVIEAAREIAEEKYGFDFQLRGRIEIEEIAAEERVPAIAS